MSSVIEEIKSRLNIVDVVGGYLKLDGAGGNYKARCPFHNERSPSFFISPSRQTYHCFGCNRGGDLISFVEEIEGLDFSGALKVLAERAGVELRPEKAGDKEAKDEREVLYRTLELATKFYEAVLPKFPNAVEYLTKRGLNSETSKDFRVGFAPDEWRALSDFLTKKGVSENMMEKAGLVVRSQKGIYDRFRGRVMFPITDSSGRVVAFSGRVLGEDPGKTLGATASAKYVNSPETEIFHKSRAMFGFFQAKESMRHEDTAVIVEGQMDLVMSHQAGVKNTVASSGTALTALQLALIKRFTKNVVLALDADDAGRAAVLRAIELALSLEMEVYIVKLPLGRDPGDMALADPIAWKKSVGNKMPVIDYYLELLPELHKEKLELLAEVTKIIVPFIAETKGVIKQAHYIGKVSELLRVKEDAIWDEVKKRSAIIGVTHEAEKLMARIVPLSRRLRIERTILGALMWQEEAKDPVVPDIKKYRIRFEILLGGSPPVEEWPHNKDKLIFEAEARFHGNEKVEQEIEELLKNMEEEVIREKFSEKMEQLKDAETKGDIEQAQKLLAECQEISKQLHLLVNSPK